MLRRLVPATAAAALLLSGLTACSAQNSSAGDCVSPLRPGALSDSVTVLGEAGEAQQVSIPRDVEILNTQRTIVSETEDRDAARVTEGTLLGLQMALYDASTGKQVYGQPGTPPVYMPVTEESASPITDAVLCAAVGDRVVLALSPEDAAPLAMQIGGTPGAAIVGVLDVASAAPLSSQGAARGLPAGFPAVVTDAEGRAGVVLPPNAAPRGVSSAVRIAGDGAAVGAANSVVAQVLEVGWNGTVGKNTWETGPIMIGDEQRAPQDGDAYRAELTGKKVGSQVVVVDGSQDDAKVYVVDILGVA